MSAYPQPSFGLHSHPSPYYPQPSPTSTIQRPPDSLKLFIGRVPLEMTNEEIKGIMEQYGEICECVMMKDRQGHKGYGFVIYNSAADGKNAIEQGHNKLSLKEGVPPIILKVADGEEFRHNYKLWVGHLAPTTTNETLAPLFTSFGVVQEVVVLMGKTGSKGCGFVTMSSNAEVDAAIEALNGKVTQEGMTAAMVVRRADTEETKRIKYAAYGGYGGGGPAMGGWGRGRGMMMMNHAPQSLVPPSSTASSTALSSAWASYYAAHGMSTDDAAAWSGMAPAPTDPYAAYYGNPSVMPSMPSQVPHRGGPLQGPRGSNIYIHNLPKITDETALRLMFSCFGDILSITITRDPHTGNSKGFGFVSFANPSQAAAAITAMNGTVLAGRTIKVELKAGDGGGSGMPATSSNAYRPY